MEVVRLGKSGLKVSRICLGTMTFGGGADEDTSFKLMDRFVETAEARGITPAQLAEPRVTCPIIGARNMAQLNDAMGGLEVALTAEERAEVPAVLPGRWVGADPVYDRKVMG